MIQEFSQWAVSSKSPSLTGGSWGIFLRCVSQNFAGGVPEIQWFFRLQIVPFFLAGNIAPGSFETLPLSKIFFWPFYLDRKLGQLGGWSPGSKFFPPKEKNEIWTAELYSESLKAWYNRHLAVKSVNTDNFEKLISCKGRVIPLMIQKSILRNPAFAS